MAKEFDEVRFVVEDLGASPLAESFGIDRYPAVFVDQALVARPQDFYSWGGPETGKYLPWSDAENRRRFQRDVRQMLEMRVRGEDVASLPAGPGETLARLPDLVLRDMAGKDFRLAPDGKPILVELWAPWCPPCLRTLEWLKQHEGDRFHFVGIAVESERAQVEATLERIAPPGRYAMGDAEIVERFGGLSAVPALFIADRDGRIVKTIYGAPPDLHDRIEAELDRLAR